MAFIELEDRTLMEVEVPPEQAQQISGGGFAHRVGTNLDRIRPLIAHTCRSVVAAWQHIRDELGKEITIFAKKNAGQDDRKSTWIVGSAATTPESCGGNSAERLACAIAEPQTQTIRHPNCSRTPSQRAARSR